LLLLIGWLGETFFGLPVIAATVRFYITAYIFGGWDISQHAWHAIKEKHFDTDLLMVMAALGAAFSVNLPKAHCFSSSLASVTRWKNAPSTAPARSPRAGRPCAKTALVRVMAKNRNCLLNHCNSKMLSSSALVCAFLWMESS
jgi:hypothetical protein